MRTAEGYTFTRYSRGSGPRGGPSVNGFMVESPEGKRRYIYLNPTSEVDDGSSVAEVFLYEGESGDPAIDSPLHWYHLDFDTEDGG